MKQNNPINNKIPLLVVKSLLKASKQQGCYDTLRSVISMNNFVGCYMKMRAKFSRSDKHHFKTFLELAQWVDHEIACPSCLLVEDLSNIPPAHRPYLFKYVTDLTNHLLHNIFEVRGYPMSKIGRLGQNVYDLVCQTILKDDYHEDDETVPLEEITDIEQLKGRIFNDFLTKIEKDPSHDESYDLFARYANSFSDLFSKFSPQF